MQNKGFYRAFEEVHRGSRKLIKNRVRVYLPFVLPLKKLYPEAVSLDIGCGRGEWIELLNENNMRAKGIDLDAWMLEACKKINLDVLQGDGLEYLKKQSDDSLIVVSAFHVVEHISFEKLQFFVKEALRVLKPGGLLIMETPNPENIKIATENFYLDPTHIKPIPSALLSFLPEFYGYKRTKVIRLQESKELASQENVNLLQVIEGASPDYAVIAQKNAKANIFKKFNDVFSQEFGLPLSTLAQKFEFRLATIEVKASEAEAKASEAEAKASEAEAKASEAEAKASEAVHNYYVIMNSNSWRITKPLRLASKASQWFFRGVKSWITFAPGSRPRRVSKQILLSLKYRLNKYPKIKLKIKYLFYRYPLLRIKINHLIMSEAPPDNLNTPSFHKRESPSVISESRILKEISLELKKRGVQR